MNHELLCDSGFNHDVDVLRSVLDLRSERNDGGQRGPPAPAPGPDSSRHLLDPALVPVAGERDARRTVAVLGPYLREHGGSVVVVHVVPRRPGWPNPAPPAASAAAAERMLEVATEGFGDAGVPVETELLAGEAVAETIVSAVADFDADSIAFVRRGGSRLVKLLAGDVERRLLDESDCPVLVFTPDERNEVASPPA